MEWELKKVDYTEWRQDKSGYYILVHHVKNDLIRLDIMSKIDMPIISFQGIADNIRKHSVRLMARFGGFSAEHASYIGAELARCAILKENYVQD
ncbi:hypothetical protein LCGC14_1567060 [marine sediment metagenome]|uniref:DUF4346 domain-containing protein n=1 Tax=marine sediment metagenome TaxID=412755 RepID=A0A0F9IKQ9_9ZZZZ